MTKDRLLAFSDGVIAILITIMVLELHKPEGGTWHDLRKVLPVLFAYVLSFVLVGIYWTNHHHMLTLVTRINGAVLWANLHLLFWLSLIPFTTDWASETDFPAPAVAAYGIDLLGAAVAYFVLQFVLIRADGPGSPLAAALGSDVKGKGSTLLYVLGIAGTFVDRWVGVACYIAVSLIWFIPDRRIERALVPREAAAADQAGIVD